MPRLIYAAIASLDGYVEDAAGTFDWATPDEEVHRFVNDLERPVGTYLYGRRMYETMRFWETAADRPDQPQFILDYADIWRAAEKIVYSRSLTAAPTERTRIERAFDPEAVGERKARGARDMTVGGAELAAHAFKAGLVDRLQLFVAPVVVGGGKPCLPHGVRMRLEPVEVRRFSSGVVFLSYDVRS